MSLKKKKNQLLNDLLIFEGQRRIKNIINGVLLHSLETSFTGSAQDVNLYCKFEKKCKITSTSCRGHRVKEAS